MDRREELVAKYPKILSGRGYPGVGEGWLDIIDELCIQLQKLTDDGGLSQVRAAQIKEKFGGLRFYVDGASHEHYLLIEKAENKAEVTCETCGKPGAIGGKYWLKAACEEHSV